MTTPPASALDRLLQLSCAEIERRAALAEPIARDDSGPLRAGAAAFRTALNAGLPGRRDPASSSLATVPATRYLRQLDASPGTPPALSELVLASAPEIPWEPTARLPGDTGETVALGLIATARDLGEVDCGLMLIAPGAVYPEHAHRPQEIYLPIAGQGEWRFGGSGSYRRLDPDALVYNNPRDRHGTKATDGVVVALYILWP